jgi:uncharacterized protein YtpQ (UPF0354 family)
MLRILALLCILLCASGQAGAQDGARAYTEQVAQGLRAKLPQLTITVTDDFTLSLKPANEPATSLSTRNLYNDYKSDPAILGKIVDLYANSLTEKPSGKLDRARIIPVIKDRPWLESTQRFIGHELLAESFNNELVVVYAEDSDKRTRYLQSSENAGVDRKDLRKLAVANLEKLLPKIEMADIDGLVTVFSAGGDYEASLLLFDHIWNSGQVKVKGDIVVAVPAKDTLLVTGSQNRKGLAGMRKLVAKLIAEDRYRLTDTLFVYRNGRFVKFGKK